MKLSKTKKVMDTTDNSRIYKIARKHFLMKTASGASWEYTCWGYPIRWKTKFTTRLGPYKNKSWKKYRKHQWR